MYELQQVGEKSYYINSPAKIGIYRQNETDIYLIDSGNDKEAAKKIIKIAAQQNWTIKGIVNTLLEICSTPQNSENILQMLFDKYELSMNFEQYVLVGSTIRSYLSWLKDLGKLSVSFENNMLQWKSIQSSN